MLARSRPDWILVGIAAGVVPVNEAPAESVGSTHPLGHGTRVLRGVHVPTLRW